MSGIHILVKMCQIKVKWGVSVDAYDYALIWALDPFHENLLYLSSLY